MSSVDNEPALELLDAEDSLNLAKVNSPKKPKFKN